MQKKQIMLSLPLLYVFFLFPTLLIFKSTAAKCHVDDEAGLLAFKSGISSDPSGILESWKSGTDCCSWWGVQCRVNNRVTELYISGMVRDRNRTLSGTISPSLSKLQHLSGIYLLDLGNLSGPFPSFIFNLPNLQFVYIENNKLSGRIPESVGKLTQLSALSLAGNRFSGPIPSSLGQLTQLTHLRLGGNLLTGTIPDSIQKLKNLFALSFERNKLSGPIPDIFHSFPGLSDLQLSHNRFSGKIPGSISALAPNLRYLQLGHNALSGQIPEFLGNFHSLDTMDLSWNSFSGVVPKSFINLTKIFNLDLSHNLLVDPFPEMKVKGIESLDLSYNKFHLKTIPSWVTTSVILTSLKLAKCGINIKLDDWKPKDTYLLDYVDLSENEISGSPIGLLNRTDYLVGFYASGNKLKFNLENVRITKTLKYLDLSRNLVYGKVPTTVSGLEKMNISYNHLCGALPVTKFPASSFIGNDCLCGSPLPPCKA